MTLQELLNKKIYTLESNFFEVIINKNIQDDTYFKLIFSGNKSVKLLESFMSKYCSEEYFLNNRTMECFIPVSKNKNILLGCPIIRCLEYSNLNYNDKNYYILCTLSGTVLNAENFKLIQRESAQHVYSFYIKFGPIGTGLYKTVSQYKIK